MLRVSGITFSRKSQLRALLSPKLSSPNVFSTVRFQDLKLAESLVRGLEEDCKISKATVVQANAFSPIIAGKDVTVCSETGSGKTLAYLVPLMDRLLKQKKSFPTDLLGRANPPVVVLCPSSDLCKQILEVASQIDRENAVSKQWLSSEKLENIFTGERIRWGAVDLVVSTPGKFVQDLTRFRQDKLYPSTLVFDEADFMFHGATASEMNEILSYVRPKIYSISKSERDAGYPTVQCVFVSATLPDIGKRTIGPMLVQRFMGSEIVETEKFHTLPSSIERVEFIPELEGDWNERCYQLTQLLKQNSDKRALVFTNSQQNANVLTQFLLGKKWPVSLFKKGKENSETPVTVSTDAGSRGIDWNGGVDLVVNFQMPTDVVSWIHRAGRCGRLGRPGTVVSFYKKQDEPLVEALKLRLEKSERLDRLFSRKRSFRKLRLPSS